MKYLIILSLIVSTSVNSQIYFDKFETINGSIDTISLKNDYLVLYNTRSCLICYNEIKRKLDSLSIKYIVVLYKSDNYLVNLRNLKIFQRIFTPNKVTFSKEIANYNFRTPAIISKYKLINYNQLFIEGVLIDSFERVIKRTN